MQHVDNGDGDVVVSPIVCRLELCCAAAAAAAANAVVFMMMALLSVVCCHVSCMCGLAVLKLQLMS